MESGQPLSKVWCLTIALIAAIFIILILLLFWGFPLTGGDHPVPNAWYLTIALIAVIFVLLLFPSLLAFFSKRTATAKLESPLRSALDQGVEKPEQLEKVAQLYATSVDVEGIAASTRMTIATIALLIVGICLFSLLGLATYTTQLVADNSTNANATIALTNSADKITQIISIVLGILGGVLSAAVGFFFGSQAQTGAQLAAKGLEDARKQVEAQIQAAEAAKNEFLKLKQSLNLTPTAVASAEKTAIVRSTVKLDGSASRDPDGDPLTYAWTVKPPTGSSLTLTGISPTFVPDQLGEYNVSLVVNDGTVDSAPTPVTITTITTKQTIVDHLQNLQLTIRNKLVESDFRENAQATLNDSLAAVVTAVNTENYKSALDTLQNDTIKKTDGCASSFGKPDSDDLITNCEAQSLVYSEIMFIIKELEALQVK